MRTALGARPAPPPQPGSKTEKKTCYPVHSAHRSARNCCCAACDDLESARMRCRDSPAAFGVDIVHRPTFKVNGWSRCLNWQGGIRRQALATSNPRGWTRKCKKKMAERSGGRGLTSLTKAARFWVAHPMPFSGVRRRHGKPCPRACVSCSSASSSASCAVTRAARSNSARSGGTAQRWIVPSTHTRPVESQSDLPHSLSPICSMHAHVPRTCHRHTRCINDTPRQRVGMPIKHTGECPRNVPLTRGVDPVKGGGSPARHFIER